MRRIRLTQRAAEEIVAQGTQVKAESTQEIADPPEFTPGFDVRLAQLKSSWTKSLGLWKATACFVVNNRADDSFVFDVCAPAAAAKPNGNDSMRFYVVWRGRWESLHGAVEIPKYLSGDAIQVSGDGHGNYVVDNYGLREGKIPGQNYSDWGTLYFDKRFFQWIGSTLDIVSKNEISLKTRFVQVVTGATLREGRLELTTDTVRVLDQ